MFNRNAIEARQADRDSLAQAMAEYERSTPVTTEPIRPTCGYNRVSGWDSSTSSKEARRKRAAAPLRAKAEDARRKKGAK